MTRSSLLRTACATFFATVVSIVLVVLSHPTPAAAYNVIWSRWSNPLNVTLGTGGITGLNGVTDAQAQAAAAQVAPMWDAGRFVYTVGGGSGNVATESCYFPKEACGSGQPLNGPAVTYPTIVGGFLTGALVAFNQGAKSGYPTYLTWSNVCPMPSGDTSVQAIALHEFGHALGLGDLYTGGYWNPPDSIMGAHYGAGNCTPALGEDDRSGMANLYGERQYLPSVFSNDGGFSSVLELSADSIPQYVDITFYPANTSYGGTSYGIYNLNLSSSTTPAVVNVNQYLPGGQVYSAIIDSSRPFAVVNKMFNTGGQMVDAVNGVMTYDPTQPGLAWNTASGAGVTSPPVNVGSCPESNSNSVYLPLLMNGNAHGALSTTIYVMDAGPNACNQNQAVTIKYYSSGGGFSGQETISLNEDRMTWFSQYGDPNVAQVASAVITGPENLVATVLEINSSTNSVQAYNGFTSAVVSNVNYLPLVQVNNNGWSSGLAIQNISAANETIVLYLNGQTWGSGTILPYSSLILFPIPFSGITWGSGYVATSGQGVAVVANQLVSNSSEVSTYSAFTNGTVNHGVMPSLQTSYGQQGWTWNSGFVIENVSSATHTYGVGWNSGYMDWYTLNPYQGWALFPVAGLPANSDQAAFELTSDGGAHVEVVNTVATTNASSDLMYTYPATMR